MIDYNKRFKFAKKTPQENLQQCPNVLPVSLSHSQGPQEVPKLSQSEPSSHSRDEVHSYKNNLSVYELANLRDQMESMVVRHQQQISELERENMVLQSHILKIQQELENRHTESILYQQIDRMSEMQQLIKNLQNEIIRRESRELELIGHLERLQRDNYQLMEQNRMLTEQLSRAQEFTKNHEQKVSIQWQRECGHLRQELGRLQKQLQTEKFKNQELCKDIQCMLELQKS